jgi:hypothetical protein
MCNTELLDAPEEVLVVELFRKYNCHLMIPVYVRTNILDYETSRLTAAYRTKCNYEASVGIDNFGGNEALTLTTKP